MKRPTKRTLTGRWRITKMALWDKDFLDMMEPAYIAFDGKLGGEFAFVSQVASTVEKPPKASSLPGRVTTRWMKPRVMAGLNCRKTVRSKEKSASIMAMIQPSRLADGEFFNSLLAHRNAQSAQIDVDLQADLPAGQRQDGALFVSQHDRLAADADRGAGACRAIDAGDVVRAVDMAD